MAQQNSHDARTMRRFLLRCAMLIDHFIDVDIVGALEMPAETVDKEARVGWPRGRSVAELYNTVRPHEALGQEVPLSRYTPSPRSMPERIPAPEYGRNDTVRSVGTTKGYISFKGRFWRVPDAFRGERVAIRPTDHDGVFAIFFAARRIATIDLQNKSVA